jgi:invasion protein IalB
MRPSPVRYAQAASAIAFLTMAGGAGAQTAQAPQPLPPVLTGGASAITETHGDWTVNCQVVQTAKICRFSHQQFDRSNANQRLLAVELGALSDKSAGGTIVLPFGLALAKGISISIDDNPIDGSLPFSTCLVVGCLVPVSFDEAMVGRLKAGVTLKIAAFAADSGQPIAFSVPLQGFTSALSRTASLASD